MKIKTFEAYNIKSTTGNSIIAYFETGQGSKYLRTDKCDILANKF